MANDSKEWVDWQNTKVLQKAALVDEAGNMLALRRVETGPASRPGKWDLPGGSIDKDDIIAGRKPHEVSIRREIEQETGLEVASVEPVFVDSWVFSRSVGEKPAITLSDEHTQSMWAQKESVLSLDFGEDGGLHTAILQSA